MDIKMILGFQDQFNLFGFRVSQGYWVSRGYWVSQGIQAFMRGGLSQEGEFHEGKLFHNGKGFTMKTVSNSMSLFFKHVHFTYKRPTDQSKKASVNQYFKFKAITDIKVVLTQCGQLDDFAKSYFGHFLSFDVDAIFSSHLGHNLLVREITVKSIGQYEI